MTDDITTKRLDEKPEIVIDMTLSAVRVPNGQLRWRLEFDQPCDVDKGIVAQALAECGTALMLRD